MAFCVKLKCSVKLNTIIPTLRKVNSQGIIKTDEIISKLYLVKMVLTQDKKNKLTKQGCSLGNQTPAPATNAWCDVCLVIAKRKTKVHTSFQETWSIMKRPWLLHTSEQHFLANPHLLPWHHLTHNWPSFPTKFSVAHQPASVIHNFTLECKPFPPTLIWGDN